jgi:hypothetical protein
MNSTWHDSRYSVFLFSFLLVLFGDILISTEWDPFAQTVLILLNMVLSLLLFRDSHKLKKRAMVLLVLLGAFFRIYDQMVPAFPGYAFLFIYLVYFLLVSYQIYADLMYQKKLGIETLSAAFSGYILLGTAFSLIFVSMGASGAFKGPNGIVPNADYLYFSFVSLLTIGYGDIVPVTEISKKVIILEGLMGQFYTLFVVGIVIGKFLNNQNTKVIDT